MEITEYWRTFDETYEIIYDLLLGDNVELDATEVRRGSKLADDLGVDSLHRINLALDIEKQYGIKLTAEDLESFRTEPLGDIVRLVLSKRGIDGTGVLPHGVV